MVMKFKKYPIINSINNTKFVDDCKEYIENNNIVQEFIVLEKVLGVSYALYVDFYRAAESKVLAAKKKDFISTKERFFNHEAVFDRYAEAAFLIAREFTSDVIIYGELFGGSYPGYASKQGAVRKEVKYCPIQDFIVFDIAKYSGGTLTYLSHDAVVEVCKKVGIPVLEPIFKGTIDECLAFNPEFNSTIPAMYGLPILESNRAAGVVIKHNLPVTLHNDERIIFKHKNLAVTQHKKAKSNIISDNIKSMLNSVRDELTINRMREVFIKLGQCNFNSYVTAFIDSAIDSSIKEEYNNLDEVDKHRIKKCVKKEATKIVKKVVNNRDKIHRSKKYA